MPRKKADYSQGERWFLLYQYFIKNSNKNSPITFDDICNHLLKYNIVVHPNTLRADIATLQSDIFGLNIEYNRKYNKGAGAYVLQNPLFEPAELRYITDSIQASKFLTQTEAQKLTRKISAFSNRESQKSLNTQAVVVDRVRNMNDSAVKDADKIYQAISTNRKIAFKVFHYKRDGQKDYSHNGKPYIVSPYSTLWLNGYYYLYAYVDGENRFRYFRIDRMEGITKPLPEAREGKDKFDANNLKHREVKIFSMKDGKDITVKICFNNGLVDAVRDQFGKDVIMIPQDENHFTVSVKVRLTRELYSWLFTFGRGAKIVAPVEVADKMREYAENIAEMYKDDGEM